jgi:septal ring factor EnvC (AmiA/AmiB activator)
LITAQTPTPDRDRAAAAAKRTEDRLRALQREADALAAQERTVLVDLRKLEVERQISIEQLNRIEREQADVQRKLDAAESRAAALAQAAATQLPDVEARLEHLYKMGRAGYWRLLLNVDDLQALGRAYRTASTLTEIDRARVQEYYATLDALALERKALQARAEEIARLQAEAVRARAAAEKAVAARTALVNAIDARRESFRPRRRSCSRPSLRWMRAAAGRSLLSPCDRSRVTWRGQRRDGSCVLSVASQPAVSARR